MINFKTLLVFLAILATCYCQHNQIKYIKKKRHHGLHHIKFLHYLVFLAIKLKLVVFFGTIFTIGLVAAKIFGVIKLTEYMKHKYNIHEEKIVYIDPHDSQHHHHDDYGGYSGGYSGGFSGGFDNPGDFASSKVYPSSYGGSDITFDHPPGDTERYGTALDQSQYPDSKITSRNVDDSYGSEIYNVFMQVTKKLRGLNITEKAFTEMGIRDDNCKKKFVCQADYNSEQNTFLQTGFNILSDESYQKFRPNITITSEEDCDALYKECED